MGKINKIIKRLFLPKEIKIALNILNEVELEFRGDGFQLVKGHIKKSIFSYPDEFAIDIRQLKSPREWVYGMIVNVAGDFAESGNYHLYRGIINPMGPGNELLKIYYTFIDRLVEMKVMDSERAEKEKSTLRSNIKFSG